MSTPEGSAPLNDLQPLNPSVPVTLLPVEYSIGQAGLQGENDLVQSLDDPARHFGLIFWSTTRCLVAPRSLAREPLFPSACARLARSGWPVYLRNTGGDVTPQGPGILNVSAAFVLDATEGPSITGVYELFCQPIITTLARLGAAASTGSVTNSFCDGRFNVVVQGMKVAGTAQRWLRTQGRQPRQAVFVHALLLIDADIDRGVAAVNRLYDACALERHADRSRHANLADLVSPVLCRTDATAWFEQSVHPDPTPTRLDCHAFASLLEPLYLDLLASQTS